ncbi:MAG: iron-sulfur cluster assembly protein, partial [Actinomycetota bacterium]|nr:iron-sulfur cluster assembly protein [Actinomycetota bacterium]
MDTAPISDERETAAWDALSQVIDPELGLPVTDLGLIYRVEIDGV